MLQGRMPLVLAAVFAVLAAVVAYLAIKERTDRIAREWRPVRVLAAEVDLEPGDTLSSKNVSTINVPEAMITDSYITVKQFKAGTRIYGQKVSVKVNEGDPLLMQHIHSITGDQHLAEAVQKQGRAVSIRVSPESSVHHWTEPGDRVDVIGVFRDPKTREMVSVTMLQNVIVLATGRIGGQTNLRLLSENERSFNTVTLQVFPEAAEMLVLGQDLGTLYLSLRNPEDNAIAEMDGTRTSVTTLLTGERSKRISRMQSKVFKVEIIRGRRAETQIVP